MATAKNVQATIKPRKSGRTVQGKAARTKSPQMEEQKKRENIQRWFWGIVGSVEHINIPKLEDVIRKEFHCSDYRFVVAQVRLMQTEGRIRVQEKVKVWINRLEREFL